MGCSSIIIYFPVKYSWSSLGFNSLTSSLFLLLGILHSSHGQYNCSFSRDYRFIYQGEDIKASFQLIQLWWGNETFQIHVLFVIGAFHSVKKRRRHWKNSKFLADFSLKDFDLTVLGVSLVIYTLQPCWLYNSGVYLVLCTLQPHWISSSGCSVSALYTLASLDIQFRVFILCSMHSSLIGYPVQGVYFVLYAL